MSKRKHESSIPHATSRPIVKLIRVLMFGMGVLHSTASWSEVIETNLGEKIQTIGGALEVKEQAPFTRELLLNGEATGINGELITILRKYHIDDKDVVLISTQCSGSSCRWEGIDIVMISHDKKSTVAKYAENDHIMVSELSVAPFDVVQQGDGLRMTGMFLDGRRTKTKTWIYQDGVIRRDR